MSKLTAEELKIIADGMYPDERVHISEPYDIHSQPKHVRINATEYNPITNNGQMVEIMEKLKIDVEHRTGHKKAWLITKKGTRGFNGKTINEAVCRAALEYFKGRDNE